MVWVNQIEEDESQLTVGYLVMFKISYLLDKIECDCLSLRYISSLRLSLVHIVVLLYLFILFFVIPKLNVVAYHVAEFESSMLIHIIVTLSHR